MARLTPQEQHIIDESSEISIGEAGWWTTKALAIFPALRSKNYQLYFSGQLVSLIGTWLQIVAQSWLVLELTNSAFLIGLVAAAASLPTLLFAAFGGLIVDAFPKRKILFFTQTSSMILAFILGILAVLKIINVWEITLLAFLLGVVNAIDIPARQAFAVEMVGKQDLASAISLNSGIFNGARVIGPSLAGFLIGVTGTGGAFILNGFSYIAVIFALSQIKVKSIIHKTHPNPLKAIKEGVSYALAHPIIRTLLVFAGVVSIFGWSFTTVLPIIARNIYHSGATGLGYLYAAMGLGAVSATVAVSALSNRVSALIFILGGNVLFSVAIILFTLSPTLVTALIFLFLAGFGLLSMFSMINTTIQSLVEDRYRGRVLSLYTIMFLGMTPFGNLQVGYLSEHFGTGFAIRLGAILTLLFGALIFVNREKIRKSHTKYKQLQKGIY